MWKLLNRIFSGAEWRLSLWQQLFGAGGILTGSAAMTWATWATSALAPYAPAVYVASFLLGGLAVAAALAAYGWFRDKIATAELRKIQATPPISVNPMQDVFQKQRIHLDDFRDPIAAPVYVGKRFIDCDILGPAVVTFLTQTHLLPMRCINCDMVMIIPPKVVYNAITFDRCQFIGCKFIHVTFYVDQAMRAELDKSNPTPIQWLN